MKNALKLALAAWLLLLPLALAARSAPARPNIVYILADDMGIGDVSCLNSNSAWKTPHLDRLARAGRTFTDAHSASGVCTPSRYALLTGRHPWRGKLKSGVLYGYDPSLLEPGRLTVASFLRAQGYATAMVGKWHLGLDWARSGPKTEEVDFSKPFGGGPLAHGFDTFFGISASLDMPPYVYLRDDRSTTLPTARVAASPSPKMWRAGVVGDDFRHNEVHPRFEEQALAFLNSRTNVASSSQPFFLYLALASPHTPIVPSPAFDGKTRTTPYGDFVAQVDATVGALVDALDRGGLGENTLVIFTADNGCSPAANLAELKALGHDPNGGYRGHKADLFEGGHRVPFIVRWPREVPAGSRSSATIGQLDLLATCADILRVPLPPNAGEDSASILPLLRGGEVMSPGRDALVHQSINGSFAIRQGKLKLLFAPDSGGWSAPRPGAKDADGLPALQLYDLESDPAEKKNLASQEPEVVQRLGRLMKTLLERGRTSPGPAQPYEKPANWAQAAKILQFGD